MPEAHWKQPKQPVKCSLSASDMLHKLEYALYGVVAYQAPIGRKKPRKFTEQLRSIASGLL